MQAVGLPWRVALQALRQSQELMPNVLSYGASTCRFRGEGEVFVPLRKAGQVSLRAQFERLAPPEDHLTCQSNLERARNNGTHYAGCS